MKQLFVSIIIIDSEINSLNSSDIHPIKPLQLVKLLNKFPISWDLFLILLPEDILKKVQRIFTIENSFSIQLQPDT